MRILKTIHKKNVNEISCETKPYQRDLDPKRWKPLLKSMQKDGYWPQEVIVLNQDNENVDGQHRLKAAKEYGLTEIPCVIFHFNSIEEEAKKFDELNGYNSRQKPIDQWNSKRIWGDPIAKLVYKLNEDPRSTFKGMIKVKGNHTGPDKKKFTIPSIITLLCTICFNLRAPHYKNTDHNLSNKMQNDFRNLDYDEALKKGAMFLQWFRRFADENTTWYSQPCIPTIAIIYKSLQEQGKFTNPRKIPQIADKLKNFETSSNEWKHCSRSTKINMISGHLIRNYRAFLSDFDPFQGSRKTDIFFEARRR